METLQKSILRHTTVSEIGYLISREPIDIHAAVQYYQCKTQFVVSNPTFIAQPETLYADSSLIPPETKHHACKVQNRLQLSILTQNFNTTTSL